MVTHRSLIHGGLALATLLLSPMLGAPALAASPEADVCAALAASPYQPGFAYVGQADTAVDTAAATVACEGAVAAHPDDAAVATWLARAYLLAGGHTDAAVPLLKAGVDAGNPLAQVLFGSLEESGSGVDRNAADALRLYQLAADADFIPADEALGNLYLDGYGIEHDPAKALTHAMKAAEAGLPDSQNRVGYIYAEGIGVERDWDEALLWFNRAADQGYERARDNVAELMAERLCAFDAGSQYEAIVGGNGRELLDIDPDLAIPECRDAVAKDPGSDEDKAWLARALIAGDQLDEARPLLETAAAGDNPLARTLLAETLMGTWDQQTDYSRVIDLLTPVAESGFAPAQAVLGRYYNEGLGIDRDPAQAAEWFRKAAEQGIATAEYDLGHLYHAGDGVPLDYNEAFRWYSLAADQGNVGGLYGLGQLYENGHGIDQDYAKAAGYFQQAADKGDMWAQNDLAYLYDTGQGVNEDPTMAVHYYELSADQGYPLAKANLALLLDEGRGADADPQRAFQLNTEADAAGEASGTVGLANAYLDGKVAPYDPAKARQLAQTAADQGDPYGLNLMGYLYAEGIGGPRDWQAALPLFQQAADKGVDVAADNVAETQAELDCSTAAASQYEPLFATTGRNQGDIDPDVAVPACEAAVEHDPKSVEDKFWYARALVRAGRASEAVPLLQVAAANGSAPAQTLYGDLLTSGQGTDVDLVQALSFYRQAVMQHFAPAAFRIGQSYQQGLGQPANRDLAIKWYKRAAALGMPPATEALNAMEVVASPEPVYGPGRAGPKG